jgi:hypothetical protein
MITRRILFVGLVWLSLSAPAHAQCVVPGERPVVVPPVSGHELRDAEREADREADRAAARRLEDKLLEPRSPSTPDNPASSYDVTNGIQRRSLERVPPR